jgi:hypothetical protein
MRHQSTDESINQHAASIKQLLPVNDWYAVVAKAELGDVQMEKVPLIAWAVVGHCCGNADSIEGACVLNGQTFVCGDTYEFQTFLQEFRSQVFVGYCSEGQLEANAKQFQEQALYMLQLMESRRSPETQARLQEIADGMSDPTPPKDTRWN